MALTPGTRLGPYEIVAGLGAGGMGEVYRARDTKLNRDVALKALPASFVHDPERVARFRREAHLLASLNHPHIGAIYGLEDVDGRQFLVLELVEGGTLADRLSKGRLPVSESLAVAQQIAEALEAAHEKGIVHRDLKPANIALTADDRVKVLDFGLAKAAVSDQAPANAAESPTLTIGATQQGAILGTAAYMSPEQAKGRPADQRADVWSFGCVLYEMLTGKRAFEGEDVSETLASVLRAEPDWSALPPDVSDAIRVLLKRCLLKDRHQRVANLGVARFVMSEATVSPASPQSPATPSSEPPGGARRTRLLLAAAAGLILGAIVATAVALFASKRASVAVPSRPIRFSVDVQIPAAGLAGDRDIAISPDGTRIAYRDGTSISVRDLSEIEAHVVPGSTVGRMPFFSPDGRWVGFFAGGEVRKAPVAGGTAIRLASIGAPPRGGVWTKDDQIILSFADNAGLRRVPASGGEMAIFAKPDEGQAGFSYPSLLPNGRGLVFTYINLAESTVPIIGVIELATGKRHEVLRGGSGAQYADGFLIYAADSRLSAIPFDEEHFVTSGQPRRVLENVMTFPAATANFATSLNGSLVYAPTGNEVAIPRTLVWVDRQGRETPLNAPARAYSAVRISPDGSRIALDIRDQQSDIWTWDIRRESMTRMTFDPRVDMCPVWSFDGRRIIWASVSALAIPVLSTESADGTGTRQQIGSTVNPVFPSSVAPTGEIITWENTGPGTGQDIFMVDPSTSKRTPLLATPAAEMSGDVSPDGRWLAYQSNESGRNEIYVRPFPNIDAGRWQISTMGGTRPTWSPKSDEVFFVDTSGGLSAVALERTNDTIVAARPRQLFATKYYPGFTTLGTDLRGYDVSRDGQRFLMIKEADSTTPPARLIVVVNWTQDVRARPSGN